MSTRLKEKIEKIGEIVTKISEEASEGKLIVVEGRKDAQALYSLGIEGKVLTIKTGGKSFFEFTQQLESFGAGEVVLLLDYDRRGKEATKKLQQNLEHSKVRVNTNLWRELHCLIGREVQCIESLPSYIETLKLKIPQV